MKRISYCKNFRSFWGKLRYKSYVKWGSKPNGNALELQFIFEAYHQSQNPIPNSKRMLLGWDEKRLTLEYGINWLF